MLSQGDIGSLVGELRGLRAFDLEQLRYAGTPTFPAHQPGFHYTLHRRHEPGLGAARTSASGTIVAAEHSGTHIDALCHQAEDLRMYGGCDVSAQVQTPYGFTELGVERIPPLMARGVLVDVAREQGVDRLASGHVVTGAELERAASGLDVGAGDVILVRTGNGSVWEQPDEYLAGPGLGADAGRWLAERRPLAVGADNVAFDQTQHVDAELGSLPCHVLLLVREGVYIVENLQLEELSAAGVTEFLFVCLPLKMRGVTGSPVRPLALARDQ